MAAPREVSLRRVTSWLTMAGIMRRARVTGEFYVNPLQALFVAAVVYIIVNFALSRLARWLEVRQRRRLGAGGIAVTGVEDLAVVGAQGQAAVGGAAAT